MVTDQKDQKKKWISDGPGMYITSYYNDLQ
jgi:hypothetical protein